LISSFILLMCGFYFNMPSGSDCAVAIPTSGSGGLVRPDWLRRVSTPEWVSEWVTHLHIKVPKTNFVSTLHVYHFCFLWWSQRRRGRRTRFTLTNVRRLRHVLKIPTTWRHATAVAKITSVTRLECSNNMTSRHSCCENHKCRKHSLCDLSRRF